jgi:hypothetical protein
MEREGHFAAVAFLNPPGWRIQKRSVMRIADFFGGLG